MMMTTRKFIRDNSDVVEADFSYRIEDNAIEITECAAWLWSDRHGVEAPIIKLSDAEIERLAEELAAEPSTWDYDYDYD